jgi:hypothetical protein
VAQVGAADLERGDAQPVPVLLGQVHHEPFAFEHGEQVVDARAGQVELARELRRAHRARVAGQGAQERERALGRGDAAAAAHGASGHVRGGLGSGTRDTSCRTSVARGERGWWSGPHGHHLRLPDRGLPGHRHRHRRARAGRSDAGRGRRRRPPRRDRDAHRRCARGPRRRAPARRGARPPCHAGLRRVDRVRGARRPAHPRRAAYEAAAVVDPLARRRVGTRGGTRGGPGDDAAPPAHPDDGADGGPAGRRGDARRRCSTPGSRRSSTSTAASGARATSRRCRPSRSC